MPGNGMSPGERDKFERIKKTADVERFHEIIVKYEEGLADYRSRVEEHLYEIGKIDERLGTEMRSNDPFIRALEDLMVADRDESIAEAQRRADEAKAAGYEPGYRSYQREVARRQAHRFSWENDGD